MTAAVIQGGLFASRFEILAEAGSGGTGTVYRARDRFTNENVALKVLHNQLGRFQEAERFAREAQLLCELRHPGIVGYIAHGQTADGLCYLAMEWLDGEDLAKCLERGPLTIREAHVMLQAIAEALAVAHHRGVVHRDLKPSNLFLPAGRKEHVKILDFGIARRSLTMAAVTRSGMLIGTPAYMAPEQAHGARQLTSAVDIFSLGSVFYECLTGQAPFIADHVAAVLARVLFDEPQPIRELRKEVPAPLCALLDRMLIKDVAQRIGDANELIAELGKIDLAPEKSAAVTTQPMVENPTLSTRADSDQILVNVVLASPRRVSPQTLQTLTVRTPMVVDPQTTLQTALDEIGVKAQSLLDGSLVVTLAAQGGATDQVARAAQVALVIKRNWPEAEVVLTTGLGTARQSLLFGNAIDRAAKLLRQRESLTTNPKQLGNSVGVWVDDLSARLLERYYVLRTSGDGLLMLTDEQQSPDETRLLLGKPTSCVGREQELSMLDVLLNGCIDESHARVVLINAPPGGGKSRLRHEFLRRVESREDPVTVLQGRADLMSKGAPYASVRQALRRLCDIQTDLDLAEQHRRLKSRFEKNVAPAERQRIVEFLGELCGVPFSDENSPKLRAARSDPKILSDQLSQAFTDFCRAECEQGGMLIVLDDIHWGDSLTINLIDATLRQIADQPLMVVALGRPELHEQFPRLWKTHGAQEIVLKGLSKKACERLITQALGKQVTPTTLENIIRLSMGNPLFLEELIRATAEGQVDAQPETVLAILQARLSHLDPVARRVLRAASLLGRSFWRGGLVQMIGTEAETIDRWLEHLVVLEYIEIHRDCRFEHEVEYGFRNSLMRDAVYSLLTDADRRVGHLAAARYLRDIGESEALVIAEHYQRGGELGEAITHYLRAAEQAYERHDLFGMLARGQAGIACGAVGEALGEFSAIECVARYFRLEWALAVPAGEQAIALLPLGSLYWCRAIQQLFVIMPSHDRPERMLDLIETFSRARPTAEALCAYSAAAAHLIALTSLMGDRDHAFAFLIFLEQVAEPHRAADLLLHAWTSYAQGWFAHALEPNPYLAMLHSRDSVQAFSEAQAQNGLLQAQVLHGLCLARLGALDDGEQMLRGAFTAAKATQDRFLFYWCQVGLSQLLSMRHEEAALEESCTLARQAIADVSDRAFRSMAYAALTGALVRRGRLEEATAAAADADAQELFGTVKLYRLAIDAPLIDCLLARGDIESACDLAQRDLDFLQELCGAGWLEVSLRLTAAVAFAAAQKPERARAELLQALREIDARAERITDPSWRQRFLTEVEENVRVKTLAQSWNLSL